VSFRILMRGPCPCARPQRTPLELRERAAVRARRETREATRGGWRWLDRASRTESGEGSDSSPAVSGGSARPSRAACAASTCPAEAASPPPKCSAIRRSSADGGCTVTSPAAVAGVSLIGTPGRRQERRHRRHQDGVDEIALHGSLLVLVSALNRNTFTNTTREAPSSRPYKVIRAYPPQT
jgi:hypothetical protein